ncbi:MAG: TlyA family RNA methyltransferase [Clostridia bacterium]|nr:TlyA family RNA methyltransferase [Clostridia bacterium]
MEKKRLDVLLVEKGLFPTRQKAQGAIMAGRVLVDGQKKDKAGTQVPVTANIAVTGQDLPYVSRGGLKLEKALAVFPVEMKGKTVLDVGASTGGFTDCALKHGATRVIAVDVGYGQLAWELRQDPRVTVLERTNVRYLTLDQIGGQPVDIVTVDVSFISLSLVLPAVVPLARETADYILLIKPQFEAGRHQVGKHGVVKDPKAHRQVIIKIMEKGNELGLNPGGLDYSPITGPEGNIEYLIWLTKNPVPALLQDAAVEATVQAAHNSLC